MHVFPQLRKLEHKYAGEMQVVGIHSAKFTAEKDTPNLRKAVLRYEIEHPVVNDKDFQVWQQYGARAWPTLIFIDPEGQLVGKHEGEIDIEAFDRVIGEMVAQFDDKGLIDRRPIRFKPEQEKEWERPLSFPGKVLADPASGRLFVADSNHNRVLVSSLEGQVTAVVGTGEKGLADGVFQEATFNDPQGLALEGDTLYVADTKNHAIRKVDLIGQAVQTIAGTGEQAMMFHGGGDGRTSHLNSPWDLALHDGSFYIAMAGFHQLWRLDLPTGEVRPYAGSGRERIVDGPLDLAQLAQPSGIVTDGNKLYFTDSETSSVRAADLAEGAPSQPSWGWTFSPSGTWTARAIRLGFSTPWGSLFTRASCSSPTPITTRSNVYSQPPGTPRPSWAPANPVTRTDRAHWHNFTNRAASASPMANCT